MRAGNGWVWSRVIGSSSLEWWLVMVRGWKAVGVNRQKIRPLLKEVISRGRGIIKIIKVLCIAKSH